MSIAGCQSWRSSWRNGTVFRVCSGHTSSKCWLCHCWATWDGACCCLVECADDLMCGLPVCGMCRGCSRYFCPGISLLLVDTTHAPPGFPASVGCVTVGQLGTVHV